MAELPRTASEQLAYWLDFGAPQFVYVIKAKDEDPIKVGKAIDVRSRLAEFQTGNFRELRLLRVLVGGIALEKQLHRKLRRNRVRGEWFSGELIPDFMKFTEDLAERMLLHQRETGKLPDWREFGDWVDAPKRREIAPVYTKRVEPETYIGRKKSKEDIGWMRLCPNCLTTRFNVESEPVQPAQFASFQAGLLRCRSGHTYTFAISRDFDPQRQEGHFYLIGPA